MIRTYKTNDGDIYKDNDICDPYKTYLTNGQGCNTIWFLNVKAAHAALIADGHKTGQSFNICNKCQCHYSIIDTINWNKYPPHVCTEKKAEYAKKFENNKKSN